MTRRIVFFVFLLLLFPLNAGAKTASYTLKEAVAYALDANPGVEAKLLAIDRAKMDVGVAQSYMLPTVSLFANRGKLKNSGGVGTTEDNSSTTKGSGMRVSLSLFAGFSHLNNLIKSMLSVDIERARLSQARLELIANIQLQFLNLLKAHEDMKTVQASKKRIETQLKAAQAFVKVGMAPYLNVLQNEVELSRVNQQEIRAANSIRNSEVLLNRYLGYDSDVQIAYTGDLKDFNGVVGYSEEEAVKISLYSRPDLIIAQKSIAVALKQAQVTAGRYLPQVSVSYDNMRSSREYLEYPYTLSDYERNYWSLGLNVAWEVFSGGGTTFAFLGDKKLADSLRKTYEDAMTSARAEVIRSLLDIQAAKELITASRKGVEAARESYAMADRRYSTNTGTITDLLAAQVRLTEAEADHSLALTEYHSARARFFYNIGKENVGLD